ncbi:VanZ family protein [Microbacterium sp. C23T]
MNDRITTGPRVVAGAVALLGVAALTLGPRAIVAPARGEFLRATEAVAAPVSALLPHASIDQILNTLLFVPLGAALALLLPRRLWWVAIGGGLALSATVEYLQASIPGRVPDVDDVLWNTVGTTIGVVAVTLVALAVAAAGSLLRRSVRPTRARR